jgi:hypothetical protein
LGGWATELVLTCDAALAEGSIALASIGKYIHPLRVLTLYGRSSQVCDGHILLWRNAATIGALFLTAVHTAAALYLAVSVAVVVCREGEIKAPNRQFWRRVRANVLAALFQCLRPASRPIRARA